jgi:hypothetical protein
MTDETINKIFQVSIFDTASFVSKQQADVKERANAQQIRERYYSEIQQVVSRALNDIIVRGRQQPNSQEYYESALTDFLNKLSSSVSSIRDEANKLSGAAAAYEIALQKINGLPAMCENEVKKARELQQRADAGDLDKPRKVGTRPDKLKDIRNYVEKPEDK